MLVSQILIVLSNEQVIISSLVCRDQSIPYIFELCAGIRESGTDPFYNNYYKLDSVKGKRKDVPTNSSIPYNNLVQMGGSENILVTTIPFNLSATSWNMKY